MAVRDLYVENLRAEHVESFFTVLLDDHVTRDGRTRPAISPATWNCYNARIKALVPWLQGPAEELNVEYASTATTEQPRIGAGVQIKNRPRHAWCRGRSVPAQEAPRTE